MITYYYKGVKYTKLQKLKKHCTGVWVNVVDPTVDELAKINTELGVDQSLLNDALDPNEVPRLEREGSATYIFMQAPHREMDGKISMVPLLFIIGETSFLTVSRVHVECIDEFIAKRNDFYTTQKTKLFILLFSALHREFHRHLIDINRKLRAISSQLERVKISHIEKFVEFDRVLNDFIAALVPSRSILENLLSGKHITLYANDEDLIEDLSFGSTQLLEMSRTAHKYVVNVRDASSMIMTHELNKAIRTLTALTIVLSIPTIIASFYGMNVDLPFGQFPLAFLLLVMVSIVAMGVFYAILMRNKWV